MSDDLHIPPNAPSPPPPEHEAARELIFEDLTLAQALTYLFWRPVTTAQLFWRVLTREQSAATPISAPPTPSPAVEPSPSEEAQARARSPRAVPVRAWRAAGDVRAVPRELAALTLAVLLALRGGAVLHRAALSVPKRVAGQTDGALWWLALAALVYVLCALFTWRTVWARYVPRWLYARLGRAAPPRSAERSATHTPSLKFRAWLRTAAPRLLIVPAAVGFSALTYSWNVARNPDGAVTDVVLTARGVLAWALSVLLWAWALGADVRGWVERLRGVRVRLRRPRWDVTTWALLAVTALGAWIRLQDLAAVPPEMTSDHIEKLLDALKIHDGYYAVFFPNNGGREAFQMYAVAFVADVLGLGYTFDALKVATIIEGVLTLPLVAWMARQVIGHATPRRERLGRWVGVSAAGLLAISSWHLMLSRLGLRIVLTPLVTALVIGFLARALRHDRTGDYLALGAALGAGTYFYQAARMLPLVVAVGVGLALLLDVRRRRDALTALGDALGVAVLVGVPMAALWYAAHLLEQSGYRNVHELGAQLGELWPILALGVLGAGAAWWRAEGQRLTLRRLGGLLTAAVIALALYVPMYHYSRLYPDQFWNRTRGRLFGEDAFVRVNENGVAVPYEPTLREEWDRFWAKRDVFVQNYKDALRMYHWQGDGAWINNAHGNPALDAAAGGLLALGLVMWAVWALRRRDAVWALVPPAVLIMLLPTALTLAYTIENPSFTRASGTIPPIFLLAGLPLGALAALLERGGWHWRRWSLGALAALVMLAALLGWAQGWDRENFFTEYRLSYSMSWKPYREIAKPLREFAQGEGSYGNAFMIAYPHWLDHRILGAMAGDIRWPNGVVSRERLPGMVAHNQGTPYQYDPTKPLFVMYHPDDVETAQYLQRMFPGGDVELYRYRWEIGPDVWSEGEFYIYKVMAGRIVP